MSRIILVFCLLINCGCVALKTPVAEYSLFKVFTFGTSEMIYLGLSVNESRVLRCECWGEDAEIVGLQVRLFAPKDGDYWISDGEKLRLDDDEIQGVLYNPDTRKLWISRVYLSKFPTCGTSCSEGGVPGGIYERVRHFDPQVKMPDDLRDYLCLECEMRVKVHDKVKTYDTYLFQRGIDMKEVKGFRRLYHTEDESGCGWL